VRIQLIDDLAALEAYHAAWDRLLQHSPTNTTFQTFAWLTSWGEVFGEDYGLRILLGFEGDSLVAAAPLVLSTKRLYWQPMTCLEFAGAAPSDYTDFLYRDEDSLRGLIRVLRTELDWDVLDLERIPSASPTTRVLAEEFPGWRGAAFPCDVASAYVFGPGQDGSDILNKKSVQRNIKGLQRAGTVTVRHLTQAELIEPELEAFFTQHVERRSLTDAPSLFLDPRERLFYHQLTRRLAPRGQVLFSVITLNDHPVAFHYGFVCGQRLLWYKPSFSNQHAQLSPGKVLIAELFKYCHEHALTEFDFTIGDDAYKEHFTNIKRYNLKFQTFRNGLWQHVGHADRALRERAKRVPLVRQLHTAWGRVRRRASAEALPG
jgi:CelD/BcsL family acetyltransferase involved in cellulose biosynthesis